MITSNSLLSPDEQTRLAKLLETYPTDENIRWVHDLALKLAALKHTEAEFPERMALVNHYLGLPESKPEDMVAFAIKLVGTVPVEQTITWVGIRSPGTVELFSHEIECPISDALLLIRPYARLISSKSNGLGAYEALEKLAGVGTVKVLLDERVAYEGALAGILVDQDGRGMRRQPIMLRKSLDEHMVGFRAFRVENDTVLDGSDVGIFLPHRTSVKVVLDYPIEEGGEFKIATGLVMARYTTKGVPRYSGPMKVKPIST